MSEKVNVSESGDRVYNTRRLQIFELNHFMGNVHDAVFDGVCFTSPSTGAQYSFNHAVELFNDREDKDAGEYLCFSLKLRYSKHHKKILCTSHMIKTTGDLKELAESVGVEPVRLLIETMNLHRLR